MSAERRITGGPMYPNRLTLPTGYQVAPDGTDFAPGLVGSGPFAGNEVTVCLLPGDEGEWFKKQIAAGQGGWTAYPSKEQGPDSYWKSSKWKSKEKVA